MNGDRSTLAQALKADRLAFERARREAERALRKGDSLSNDLTYWMGVRKLTAVRRRIEVDGVG